MVYVVLKDPVELEALQADLRRRLVEQLNPLFRIHELIAIDELPRTASNKVMRRKLRSAYSRMTFASPMRNPT